MSYGSGPAPYDAQPDQSAYGGQAPYGGPNQFGFGAPPLNPAVAPLPGASFGEAVKRFFQRYAQFRGYASRSEYWWVTLFNGLIGVSLYILLAIFIGISETDSTGAGIGVAVVALLYVIYGLATIIPSLALTVRRLHDNGKPGFWIFISFVPGASICSWSSCAWSPAPTSTVPNGAERSLLTETR